MTALALEGSRGRSRARKYMACAPARVTAELTPMHADMCNEGTVHVPQHAQQWTMQDHVGRGPTVRPTWRSTPRLERGGTGAQTPRSRADRGSWSCTPGACAALANPKPPHCPPIAARRATGDDNTTPRHGFTTLDTSTRRAAGTARRADLTARMRGRADSLETSLDVVISQATRDFSPPA